VLTCVSLFCGCGGLDLGFSLQGFRTTAAFDLDADAAASFSANLGVQPYVIDVSSGYPAELRDSSPDVLLAGPPCQGFSTNGQTKSRDPRNSLLNVTASYVLALQPRAVVIENVLGLLHSRFVHHLIALEGTLRLAGYRVERLRLNAADFGVAQSRKRVFLVAYREKERALGAPVKLPVGNLREALAGMAGLPDHAPKSLPSHTKHGRIAPHIGPGQRLSNVRFGPSYVKTWDLPGVFGATSKFERLLLEALSRERRRSRIRNFGDGDPVSARRLLPWAGRPVAEALEGLEARGYLRRVGTGFDLAHTYNGAYHRLRWEAFAPTVDTKFGNPRLFLHPQANRGFTVREAARLQGFPDTFLLQGSTSSRYRQVGNAVPPPVARALARLVREVLWK